jgi:DNA polymerase-3 subunit epsilon
MKTNKIAFIDIETTGLNANIHEIIEICIITNTRVYNTKIAPERLDWADEKALAINGYRAKDWIQAPRFKDVAHEIKSILQSCTIAGHNVRFDIEFLNEAFSQNGFDVHIGHRTLDTVTLAYEHLYPLGLMSLSLDSIRRFLGWSLEGNHTALKDCNDTKQLFEYLIRFGTKEKYKLLCKKFINFNYN